MKFLGRTQEPEGPPPPNTVVGLGSCVRGTLMVTGTLRIDGEFEGDILNCDRLEIGEHGIMRADVEVKEALVKGRVLGNIRALGNIEMKSGARVEGDVAAVTVAMEPGVYFSGRCTMLDTGFESVELGASHGRASHDRAPNEPTGHERPAHERPSYERPSAERASHDRASDERAGHERPSVERPVYGTGTERPASERPAYERPSPDRPGYDRPAFDRPAHDPRSGR